MEGGNGCEREGLEGMFHQGEGQGRYKGGKLAPHILLKTRAKRNDLKLMYEMSRTNAERVNT